MVQAVERGELSLEEARRQQWRKEFLNLGEILKAYDYLATTGIVPIVKLDEFEKLPQVCQAFFYQLFTMVMLRFLALKKTTDTSA